MHDKSALEIKNGQELEQFDLGTILVKRTRYVVLTGFENDDHRCFWCGVELTGSKLKRYCRGHMKEYYNHFMWIYASTEALKRADYRCENCGKKGAHSLGYSGRYNLEVHHIVPLEGNRRDFSAYNLPWNLIVLCHDCHLEIHAIMRPPPKEKESDYDIAVSKGQLVLI